MVHLELSRESLQDLLNELLQRLETAAADMKAHEAERARNEVQGIYNLLIATSHPQDEQHEYEQMVDLIQGADSRISEQLTRLAAASRRV
jgi:Rad3-related DNA helicase